MTSTKSSPKSRASLQPPLGRRDSPNAAMVDASNVPKSLKQHMRQRDQETATEQEQQEKLNQQRLSLDLAFDKIKSWNKIYTIDPSTNVHRDNDQIKK